MISFRFNPINNDTTGTRTWAFWTQSNLLSCGVLCACDTGGREAAAPASPESWLQVQNQQHPQVHVRRTGESWAQALRRMRVQNTARRASESDRAAPRDADTPQPAPHRTKHLKHPKVRGFCRKLQVALWRATAFHIPAHIHNTQRSGPDIKPDLLVLRPRAATGANRTPPPTRLNSLWKFTLIKVSARRQFTDHLIQGLYFRERRTEAQKGETHIVVRTWRAHDEGIQSPQAWPLSLDSTRLAADLPTLCLVQQKGCFHLPRAFTPHQSVSYQLPNKPHTSILKATFRAGDEEATLFCLVPDTVSWILPILSKDQAKGFLKSRKMVQMGLFPG